MRLPWYEGYHYQVKELCVGVSYQRRGVGKRLIDALQSALASQGVTRIYLLTMRHSAAETFYAQSGFTPSSELVVLSKVLAEPLEASSAREEHAGLKASIVVTEG